MDSRRSPTGVVFALWLLASSLKFAEAFRGLQLGVLVVEDGGSGDDLFCVRHFPNLHNFTTRRDSVEFYELGSVVYLGEDDSSTCGGSVSSLSGKFAFVDARPKSGRGQNCSLAERAAAVSDDGGVGLLVNSSLASFRVDEGDDNASSIPVAALLRSKDMALLLRVAADRPERRFGVYAPPEAAVDWSLFVIMLMAVFTVASGSFWSGRVKHQLRLRKAEEAAADGEGGGGGRSVGEDEQRFVAASTAERANEEISLRISPAYVLFFVVLMCGMLLLLYFYFSYLVYVIIAMFCLASTIAVYSCFEPLVMWTYDAAPWCPTLRLPRLSLCGASVVNLELRQFLLLAASVALTAVWFAFRGRSWSWILQDFLGVLFSINMLKVLRLPSLKICTVLLATLFFYDIFFVFVTPLITRDGRSVMVEVATGGDSGEQLPVVLRVPRLNIGVTFATCGIAPYSMLGFGDILVPGLLLSYCHSYDLRANTPFRLYWVVTNVSYCLGLITTFASLYLMESAQPALLYLVPFTLIPAMAVALIRGDFASMWQGDYEVKPDSAAGAILPDASDSEDVDVVADESAENN